MKRSTRRRLSQSATSCASGSSDDSTRSHGSRERHQRLRRMMTRIESSGRATIPSKTQEPTNSSSGDSKKSSISSLLDVMQHMKFSDNSRSKRRRGVGEATLSLATFPISAASTPATSVASSNTRSTRSGHSTSSFPSESFHQLSSTPASLLFSKQSAQRAVRPSTSTSDVTRLFKAVSAGAPESYIRSLIDQNPLVVGERICTGGLTPLHCAIERYDMSLDLIRDMLNACPKASAIRCSGRNAVDLMWRRFVAPEVYRKEDCKVRAAALCKQIERTVQHHTHDAVLPFDVQQFWNGIAPFVQAAAAAQMNQTLVKPPEERPVLHDCVVVNSPTLLIQLAAHLYPDQVRMHMDDDERSPLHYACIHALPSINVLTKICPSIASQQDGFDRLPLHYAVIAGVSCSDGLDALLSAHPSSLVSSDTTSGLNPVLLSACASSKADLTTTFQLLSACPSEIARMALEHTAT